MVPPSLPVLSLLVVGVWLSWHLCCVMAAEYPQLICSQHPRPSPARPLYTTSLPLFSLQKTTPLAIGRQGPSLTK